MKYLLSFALSFLCSISSFCQNWTKEMSKDFIKSPAVCTIVDLSTATVMGVPVADFPKYYAGKFSSNEEYAQLVLDKFKNKFINNFYKTTKKEKASIDAANYIVTYQIYEITEDAGFSGKYYVECNNCKSRVYSFECKDGRWNDFEELLMENVDKYWRYAKGGSKHGNPCRDNLLPKK